MATSLCIEGESMKNYNKEAALKIIINAAKGYNEKLKDRNFLIIYQDGVEVKKAQVGFRDLNYLHMKGVKSQLSAQTFFDACLKERLYNNCMIGKFINSGIYIKADYFVGNTKAVLSVGFRYGKLVDYPITLYSEDVRKLTQPTCKVLAIFSKWYHEKDYNVSTYLAKGYKVEDF